MTLDRTGRNCILKAMCSENQYTCASGECISRDMVCNAVQDCISGDDESGCKFTTKPPDLERVHKPACPLDHFFCLDNTGCIPQSKVCDSFNDCHDGSDEFHCSFDKSCNKGIRVLLKSYRFIFVRIQK